MDISLKWLSVLNLMRGHGEIGGTLRPTLTRQAGQIDGTMTLTHPENKSRLGKCHFWRVGFAAQAPAITAAT